MTGRLGPHLETDACRSDGCNPTSDDEFSAQALLDELRRVSEQRDRWKSRYQIARDDAVSLRNRFDDMRNVMVGLYQHFEYGIHPACCIFVSSEVRLALKPHAASDSENQSVDDTQPSAAKASSPPHGNTT